jgi:hypothetical protein
MNDDYMSDRVRGCIIAGAIGDAKGGGRLRDNRGLSRIATMRTGRFLTTLS